MVGFFPVLLFYLTCYFENHNASEIFTLLPTLTFPTKGLTDSQMHSTVSYALFPWETRLETETSWVRWVRSVVPRHSLL